MAHAIASGLLEAAIKRSVAKDARFCQECGKAPVPYSLDRTYVSRAFGLGCPDRHSIMESSLEISPLTLGPVDYHAAVIGSIGPMIQAWNDEQERIRNQQMFPGKRSNVQKEG